MHSLNKLTGRENLCRISSYKFGDKFAIKRLDFVMLFHFEV